MKAQLPRDGREGKEVPLAERHHGWARLPLPGDTCSCMFDPMKLGKESSPGHHLCCLSCPPWAWTLSLVFLVSCTGGSIPQVTKSLEARA